jgi:hypothetical protein
VLQQEPAKKAKSDAVVLQIDETDNVEAQNSSANGGQNGHQNGSNGHQNGKNGDSENGHSDDNWTLTGHLDEPDSPINGGNEQVPFVSEQIVIGEVNLMEEVLITTETVVVTDTQDQNIGTTEAMPEIPETSQVEQEADLKLVEENEAEMPILAEEKVFKKISAGACQQYYFFRSQRHSHPKRELGINTNWMSQN